MRVTAFSVNTSASSVARQFHRVLLLSALFVTASLNSWAQIVVSPASVSFTTKQVVGTTSASKPVTITNNGATAQAVSIVMSGDFTETDNCAGSVAGGGGTCTANIFFSPTLIGSISGAATIVDPSKSLLAFVGLTGTGLAPVTTAPASLSFGAVTIGTTSATKTFKITNNSPAAINVTGITPSSDYAVTNTGTCLSQPLNHAASCTVTVDVTPTSLVDNGAIIVTDNAPNGIPVVVKLSATGTGGAATPISLSKTSLVFKVVTGGISATQTITVTNTSASAVTMGTTTASSDYAIVNNLCTGSLAAAGTCTFGITFNPTFVGSIGGSAAIAYTGNNSPQLVNLTGTSLDDLTDAPTKLAFASQAIGTTSTAKAIKITNNYSSAIALNSVGTSGDFQIQTSGTTCSLTGGTLAAAHSCNVQIQFAPTVAGSIIGALTVANAGSPNPLLVALSGTGTGSSVSALLNPASAHQGSSETIVITGTGTHFGPTTTVNFGADITPGTLTVNGPTSASVPITIDNVALIGSRNVTITTGAEVVKPTFTVIAGVPAVTLINPNTIRPTQAESVSVTGAFTNWATGTTTASFGPGIAVGGGPVGGFGSVTVNSATSLTANLVTSGAAKSSNTVQIQTGSQTQTVKNGMVIQTCTTNPPTVVQIIPVANATNVPLNTLVQVQFSVPMNRSTFSLGNSGTTTVFFYDTITGLEIPGTISVDASGTIATITPSVSLPAGRQFVTYLSYQNYVQDTCGNNLPSQTYNFTTAFSNNTTGPTLTGTSPVNGDTNIPLNGNAGATPMVLQFNTPVDPITAQTGFSMVAGSSPVLGNFTYSTDDRTVTFTPVSPLTTTTSYTVSYSAQVTDTAGNPLTNPGSFSFTTGATGDTNSPAVVLVDPPSGTFGVGLNVTPHITFSEPINGLTIPGALSLVYIDSGLNIPAAVAVSADRLSATLTPAAPLLPNTSYNVSLCYCYTDIAGNGGYASNTTFYTGTSADAAATTVSTINPSKTQTGVPLNTLVTAVMSDDIDPTTVTNSSITLKQGTTNIPGTVTLASDGVTLTFVPTAALAPSTVYNVSVGGFKDVEGNAVTTYTSSFTTGTTGYGSGSFTLVSTNPAAGATGVSVTSPVTFTMNNLINPASVNTLSVEVYVNTTGDYVAGSYSVTGATVTFTPLTPYPGNTLMGMYIYGLTDEAGNPAYVSAGSFTTVNTVDHTAPTVTISPANATTNVGLNTQIVLTFSKSINPSTITTNTLSLFNGDSPVGYSPTVSQDNRTIVVNAGGGAFTSGATITIELTNGIQDLSGNALANTSSQFTLTTALPNTAPFVETMRPGNGATDVPANTMVTLFTSAAMNSASITGALHVTDNGVLVSGAVQLFSNAEAIEFTPSNAFNPGDLIQVFLDSSALSADNVALSSFSGQFTVAGSPSNTAASAQAVNPLNGATNVPLNTIIQVEYDQALAAGTINSANVTLYDNTAGVYLTPTLSLVGNGQVINLAPTSNLTVGDYYSVNISSAVTNTSGLAVNAFSPNFTAGTTADTAAPTIVSQAPTNNSTNIATNTAVSVNFNKIINPISVTGSTIQLSTGSTTEVPSSISFSPDYTRVSIIPLAPLPPSTIMAVAISGVTSEAGKSVASTTTHFTTAAQPDFTPPYVVNPSVQSGQTNVPVNSAFTMQFSKPMDVGSTITNGAQVGVCTTYSYNGCGYSGGQLVPATVSWSADQTTIFVVPTSPLAVGTTYYLGSAYLTDLAGNTQTNFSVSFTTAFVANTNPPTVINTSPENTETAVPVNSPVEILFNEPIQPTSIGQITLKTGGNAVAVTPTFTDASQLLTLTPALPLVANASYTLTIAGVKDTAGNQMTGTVTNTFTAGPTFDLINPSVILSDPAPNMTSIGTNVAPRIVFSKRLNPLSVVSSSNELYYNGSVDLYNNATLQYVPATVSMSADRLTATLTPNPPLQPNTSYQIRVAYQENYYDVAGNYGASYQSTFVTGAGSDTTNTLVSTITPSNGQPGVPENFQVVAVMSDDIDPTTVNNSSITVTQGSNTIAGTVTLASDGVTLSFVLAPSAVITPNTVYSVSVGGFKDTEGNTVVTSNTTFTTGTTGYGNGSFALVSTSPASGVSGISVTSPVTFTMSNLINAASVNPNTVEVYVNSTGAIVAGSYGVNGAAVTFTPLSKYPALTLMHMYVYGLADEAGNLAYADGGTFSSANTADTSAPTVTITPANGTTNAGLNTQVVLTFSKSINPATITPSSVNLLNGDVPLNPATSISGDNRTVVLNYNNSTLPAGATLTVTATNLITDLSGNALANTTSQFTTTPAVVNNAPSVLSMRPGSGATGVPTSTVITLFTTASMNAGTISGALHVSQNGVIISGTTNVGSNGQSIEFTPSSALSAGASIQVFLDSTAQDIYGNYLSYFSGQFTVAGSPTNTASSPQGVNPFNGATNVPLNTIIQVEYDQALAASTINSSNVTLYDNTAGIYLTPTLSLVGNGQVINIAPTSNLTAGDYYSANISSAVTNTVGLAVNAFGPTFTAGTTADTAKPTITAVAPPNLSTNIGTNAGVTVTFNKAINPISVTGSSIQLSGGSVTEVPSSISFTPDYTRTMIVPQAPLPSSTLMTIAISGVTSEAGVAVTSKTTTFTTMAAADFSAPYVVNPSVQSGQTVGTNAAFAMQFNKPMDIGSLDGAQVGVCLNVYYYCYPVYGYQFVPATVSWSADQTTVFIVPTSPLTVGTTYYLGSGYLTDLAGNPQQGFSVVFNTGSGTDTTGPVVQRVSPPSGFTNVPINAPVQILLNEPISGASLGGVTLKRGTSVIPATVSLFDGDQGIQLLPLAPLATSAVYTINVTGVKDITGNAQSSFPSQSFTTGTGTDLVVPTIVSTNPTAGQTGVPDNTTVQVVFSEAMDPASFDQNTSFVLYDPSNNVVPATVTFSTDYKTATLHANATLISGVTYTMVVGWPYVNFYLYDLGGNALYGTYITFTTQ
jgi:hypothetical protein